MSAVERPWKPGDLVPRWIAGDWDGGLEGRHHPVLPVGEAPLKHRWKVIVGTPGAWKIKRCVSCGAEQTVGTGHRGRGYRRRADAPWVSSPVLPCGSSAQEWEEAELERPWRSQYRGAV